MENYTTEQWKKDGYFSAKVGQAVASEVVDELICSVPPISYAHRTIGHIAQCGEPYSHIFTKSGDMVPVYSAFVYIGGDLWKFLGYIPSVR